MQANKEIGKIQKNTPYFLANALEMFIEDVTKLAAQAAINNDDSKITPSHIKHAIETQGSERGIGFLREAMLKVPDLVLVPQAVPETIMSP